MAWYRTLGPVTYTDGDQVRHITKAGVRIGLTPTQAAELAGMIVLDRTTPLTYPRADFLKYDSSVLFPTEGIEDAVYLANDSGLLYRWIDDDYAEVSVAAAWGSISGRPSVIAAGSTEADAQAALGGTATGRALFTADDAAAGRSALGSTDIGDDLFTATNGSAARDAIDAQGTQPAGFYTPVGKPDGPVGQMDSGQAVSSFGNAIGGVVSGEIVHTTVASPSAGYYQVNAGARVRRAGCEVKWAPGSVGALAIVLPVAAWATGDTAAVAGVHLVMYGNGVWHSSRWNAPGETKYAEYTTHGRPADVRDGEWRKVEIWIDPDTGEATLFHPDGSFVRFQAATIADDTGNFVIWEQFENNIADAPCVIRNLWYDTQPARQDAHAATRAEVAEILALSGAGDWGGASTVASAGTTILDVASPTVQVVTGTTTHTFQLPSTDVQAGHLVFVLSGTTGAVSVNSSAGNFINALASGQSAMFIATSAAPTTAGAWRHIVFSTITGVESLTNKSISSSRWTPRVISATSASSLTPSVERSGGYEQYNYTALAANLTINAPTGTLTDGTELLFRIKDDGTSRTLTWNAIFVPLGATIPTATVIGKVVMVWARYNLAQTRWEVYDVKQEA